MITILEWLRAFRQQQPPTAVEIQRQLGRLRQQLAEAIARRDALALHAVRDDDAAGQWTAFDDAAAGLRRQIDVLAAALPQAETQEREARERAEREARAKQMQDYQRQIAEAKAWAEAVLARLPSGEELTQARNIRDAVREGAHGLSRWSHDVAVRRPFDPLDAIMSALTLRVARIERARWTGGHPITLDDKRAAS